MGFRRRTFDPARHLANVTPTRVAILASGGTIGSTNWSATLPLKANYLLPTGCTTCCTPLSAPLDRCRWNEYIKCVQIKSAHTTHVTSRPCFVLSLGVTRGSSRPA